MKIANIGIVGILQTLSNYKDKKLPQKISYAIAKNISLLTADYQIYVQQLQKIEEIYKEDCEKDEKGEPKRYKNGVFIIKDTDIMKQYNQEIEDLVNTEVEIDLYHIDKTIFDYDDKGKYDVLTPEEMVGLMNILCIEDAVE